LRPRADDQRPLAGKGNEGPVEAVLLDLDGTLLDSNDAHAQSWSDVFREAGFDIGSETVRPLIGMGSDKLLPKLTGIDAESEEGKRLVERRKEVFKRTYLPMLRGFPDACELLDRMRSDGLALVIATSASDDELRGLLRALGAEWLIDDATTSSDADRSKPDPDIVRAAIDKAGVGPERCVMLGDTRYDVEAATRSHVRVVALRCGGSGDDELKGAAEIYDDPKALLEQYDNSLIGRGARAARGEVGGRARAGARAANGASDERSRSDRDQRS
jgi:phosphoglycolate phosphatase-like HAD superfamily hydrolase